MNNNICPKRVPVLVAGFTGGVGEETMRMLVDAQQNCSRYRLSRLLSRRKYVELPERVITAEELESFLANARDITPDEYEQILADWLKECGWKNQPYGIVVDCTSPESGFGKLWWKRILESGNALVVANKAGILDIRYPEDASAPPELTCLYGELLEARKQGNSAFHSEAAWCAGLPIETTLGNMRLSGLTLTKILLTCSGTWSGVFKHFLENPGLSFSQTIAYAKEQGWTEPESMFDILLWDQLYKVLFAAGRAGWNFDPNLILRNFGEVFTNDFLNLRTQEDFETALAQFDEAWDQIRQDCISTSTHLALIWEITPEGAKVKLERMTVGHAFDGLPGGHNRVEIHYKDRHGNPNSFALEGPGAGHPSTALALFESVREAAEKTQLRQGLPMTS